MENLQPISETGKISFTEAMKNLRDIGVMGIPQILIIIVNELMKVDMGEYTQIVGLFLSALAIYLNRKYNVARITDEGKLKI